ARSSSSWRACSSSMRCACRTCCTFWLQDQIWNPSTATSTQRTSAETFRIHASYRPVGERPEKLDRRHAPALRSERPLALRGGRESLDDLRAQAIARHDGVDHLLGGELV